MCEVSNSAGVRTSRIHSCGSEAMCRGRAVAVEDRGAAVIVTPAIGVRLIEGYPVDPVTR